MSELNQNLSIQLSQIPRILKVDAAGMPHEWISAKEAVGYYATDSVIFELGNPVATIFGGYNRITEAQSQITTNSIIAIKGKTIRQADLMRNPKLTNESLFERDRYICAYCGEVFHAKHLTREHIQPVCQKGEDKWMNVVTACQPCNNAKGGKTLEQANMSLLYIPYVPDRFESFILSRGTQGENRILADQMEFLVSKISKNTPSRLKDLKLMYS